MTPDALQGMLFAMPLSAVLALGGLFITLIVVCGVGLVVLTVVLTIYTINVMLNESRAAHEAHATTPERA